MPEPAIAASAKINERLRPILAELRRQLEQLYGDRLVKLILYGSQARGDARPWSDIDVLVVLKGPVEPGGEGARTEVILGDLSLENDVVISSIYVDQDRFENDDGAFFRNIREEGIAV